MSIRFFHWLTALLVLPFCVRGQEYSYTRYDIQHGLAGSMVYCMLQDKKGFLWFGTETGVSRFDGTHFKNFTTADGLPDNQILELFEDSKGRIWMSPFNKSVCYYFNGKLYNQQNDPYLKNLKLSGYVAGIAEDKDGNIMLMQTKRVHVLKPSGSLLVINTKSTYRDPFVAVNRNERGYFELVEKDRLFELQNDSLVFKEKLDLPYPTVRYIMMRGNIMVWWVGSNIFAYRHGSERQEFPFNVDVMSKFSLLGDSMICVNTPNGSTFYNRNTGRIEKYLENESVSTVFQDNERNLWFCTLGHGIFRLNSQHIVNISLPHKGGAKLGAYVIKKFDDQWLVGSDMQRLFQVSQHGAKEVFSYSDYLPERITAIAFPRSGNILIGSDGRLIELSKQFRYVQNKIQFLSVKDFFECEDRKDVHIASSRGGITMDMLRHQITDTFWRERSTSIFRFRDTIYVGTLDGLFLIPKDRKIIDLGNDIPGLRHRIMAFRQSADSTIWIATYNGILAYKDGKLVSAINESHGLVSNVCRAIGISGNELWVGTNKGLQRIDISDPSLPRPGLKLTTELSSEIINYVAVDSNIVAVATSEGVNLFDKNLISFNARADLYIDNVMVSGRKVDWNGKVLNLSPKDNNIRFEFAGISYRSGGDMRYAYRLIGLDSTWKETRDIYLDYPTLPGGGYRFEIQVINKFGTKSPVLALPFNIEKELWQKTWFRVLVLVTVALGIWFLLSWRIRIIRREELEKSNVRKKMAELEQLALKSQMNPHFIFNSLNSIQHYVLDKDIEGANRFISGFSRLIRQTLDISTRHEISIAEETNYLSTYLQLEKIRLENKFSFEVTVDPTIDPDDVFIPPMILQPFVENCVRHGIRYRQDNEGRIAIAFRKFGSLLDCEIEDNGIGRKLALAHKSKNPIEYQSKGISLTTDRIELLNKHSSRPIAIHIYDLEDGNSTGTGTRVIISFPLQQTDFPDQV